jgi:hypothetical protein
VLEAAIELVTLAVRIRSLKRFYLGRAAYPQARQSQHRADDLIPLYKTRSVEHLLDVEDALIQRFFDHPKCGNEAPHSGGNISAAPIHFVYLAFWW